MKGNGTDKQRRQNLKAKMVAAFGNKCCICGYDRCLSALELHHINPKEKGFSIGQRSVRAWSKIVEELRKCILLCANCHAEYHWGSVQIPENAPRFNEAFANQTRKRNQTGKEPYYYLNRWPNSFDGYANINTGMLISPKSYSYLVI